MRPDGLTDSSAHEPIFGYVAGHTIRRFCLIDIRPYLAYYCDRTLRECSMISAFASESHQPMRHAHWCSSQPQLARTAFSDSALYLPVHTIAMGCNLALLARTSTETEQRSSKPAAVGCVNRHSIRLHYASVEVYGIGTTSSDRSRPDEGPPPVSSAAHITRGDDGTRVLRTRVPTVRARTV